ncbi:MAG TPA: type II secretion system protein N [Noviherbaspirillum sp.]|uniref:type II secretion system protein N n=1 Tax=Noviherbaspirillum sp. TaxID=1926288 RepID=UPI002D65D71E|nr:type II secretion system protein N [Noviherbaspirillum sp.]HYD96448.1 type II secretion system protein N [Noviherbaspirillum sp.]
MRRLPLLVSFLLFIALCASAAYWAMQLFKPPLRPVAAPPRAAQAEIRADAAATLFGSRSTGSAAVASNYQLRGVIFSGNPRDSVAIISIDGKPAQAIRARAELAPGVTIKEVHRDHVLVDEGGGTKRVELPESAKGLEGIAAAPTPPSPVPRAVPPPPPPPAPQPGQLPGAAMSTRAQAAAQAAAAAQTGAPGQQQYIPPGSPAVQAPQPPAVPAPAAPPVPGQPVPGQAPPPVNTAPPVSGVSPAVPQQVPQAGAVPAPPGAIPGNVPVAPAAPAPQLPPSMGIPPQTTPPAAAVPGAPQVPGVPGTQPPTGR